jgi:peptidoglycan/LPS O-acetylase OafA/YrhL
MFAKLLTRARLFAASSESTAHPGYLPGLDGLRALAVLAVLLYHADIVWLPGGFLGVEVFFVVSGYLITLLLLNEYRKHQTINFRNFWRRRARRLLPALFAMLAATLAWTVVFLPDEAASLRGDAVAAFAYVMNWHLIAAQKSYFETIGRPSLLQHLWSLAVEEQFYLVWPLIFAFVLMRLKTRGALWLLLLGAALSALWMGSLYAPDADPSRVYYGTDTRAFGLLLGAALALVWSPRATNEQRLRRHWLLDGAGILALAGLGAAFLFMDEFNPFLYQGGMLLVSVATVFLIAAVVHPKSPLVGPILSVGILRWLGVRSYSLYLWHWPVFMLTRPQLDTTLEGGALLGLRFALAFTLAQVSFRFIESPLRGGILGRSWHNWSQTRGARRWVYGTAAMGALGLLLSGGIALGDAVARAQPSEQPDYVLTLPVEPEQIAPLPFTEAPPASNMRASEQNEAASPVSSEMEAVSFVMPLENFTSVETQAPAFDAIPAQEAQRVTDAWIEKLRRASAPMIYDGIEDFDSAFHTKIWRDPKMTRACVNNCVTSSPPLAIAPQSNAPLAIAPQSNAPLAVAPQASAPLVVAPQASAPLANDDIQVLAIGDSVMLGASNYLRQAVNTIMVDAKLGRQVSTAIRLLQEYKDEKRLPPIVIVHLGNNGTFTPKQFEEMMSVLADTSRVIFLTTKVPRKWQDTNNATLIQGVEAYPSALIVDWNGMSASHPEWFWKDGIHLRPDGAKFYANLVAATLEQIATP